MSEQRCESGNIWTDWRAKHFKLKAWQIKTAATNDRIHPVLFQQHSICFVYAWMRSLVSNMKRYRPDSNLSWDILSMVFFFLLSLLAFIPWVVVMFTHKYNIQLVLAGIPGHVVLVLCWDSIPDSNLPTQMDYRADRQEHKYQWTRNISSEGERPVRLNISANIRFCQLVTKKTKQWALQFSVYTAPFKCVYLHAPWDRGDLSRTGTSQGTTAAEM